MSNPSDFKETGYGSKLLWLTTGNWNADESRKENDRKRTYMMAALLIFMTLLALVLVLFKIRASSVAGGGDDSLTNSLPRDSDILEPHTRTVTTITAPTTTRASNPLTTTGTTTITTTTGITMSTGKALDTKTILLCTFGLTMNLSTTCPTDGLCDFFFFDSAYSGGLNRLSKPNSFGNNLNAFLAKATRYNQTQFGLGFSSDFLDEINEDLYRTNPVLVSSFWQKGVFHFGVIDIPVLNTDIQILTRTFRVLRALGRLAEEQKKVGRLSYVVMGTVPLDITGITERMSTIYQPDLFIGHGHYTYLDRTRPSCLIMPPTTIFRESPTNVDYPYDLGTSVRDMQTMANRGATPQWILSVTMKGRWATAALSGLEPHIGDNCVYRDTSAAFSSYTEVCNSAANLKYDNTYDAMYLVNGNRVFSYDNEVSFAAKLCSVKAKNSGIRFGIAAYDLEYDDYNGHCVQQNKFQQGYSRLRALRRIVDYFETFTGEDKERGCLGLFPKT